LIIINGIILIFTGAGGIAVGATLDIPFIGVTSGVIIALGIAALVVARGLVKGKGWAWIATVILSIISIFVSIIAIASGNFVSIIKLLISGVILYYMYRSEVKAYFGRTSIAT